VAWLSSGCGETRSIPDAGKDILPLFSCQENIAKLAKKSRQFAILARFYGPTAQNIAEYASLDAHHATRPLKPLVRNQFGPEAEARCLRGHLASTPTETCPKLKRNHALDRIVKAELSCHTDRFHIRTKNKIVIRTSQLLLGLILPLLLIAVGLIGFGKRTGLTAT